MMGCKFRHAIVRSMALTFVLLLLAVPSNVSRGRPHERPSDLERDSSAEPIPESELFAKRILPLFERHCYECHSAKADEIQGNLRLDSYEAILKGGNNGEAVTPGDVKSFLLRVIRYEVDDYKMPPRARLPESDVKDVERWIKAGAPGPKKPEKKHQSPTHG